MQLSNRLNVLTHRIKLFPDLVPLIPPDIALIEHLLAFSVLEDNTAYKQKSVVPEALLDLSFYNETGNTKASFWRKLRNEARKMPGEAGHFVIVLERIVRRSLAQFKDISDADLNRPLELPESNTAFALATHLIGSAEYWILQLAGGRDVHRDRPSEFRATGTGAELAARYKRWLTAMQELLSALPDKRMDEPVSLSAGYHPSRDEEPMTVRDALLHAVEHCALHQGHLELTRQLLGYPPSGAQ